MDRTLKDYLLIVFKGIAMGAADVVPGVSGGTIAFVSGIYEELIRSINQINLNTPKILFKEGFAAMWKSVNGNFLLALVSGIFISVITLARLIKYLLENEPVLLWSFFFGLVLASIFYVARQITKWRIITVVLLIVGAVIAYFISIIPPQHMQISNGFMFLSGALAICAMILPGISGSFILLLLGAYKPVLDAIHDKDFKTLGFLLMGAVVGLLTFSRLLKWLFDHYQNLTLATLTGFIIGSLNKIWPWKEILQSEVIDGKVKVLQEESVSPFAFTGDNQLLAALFFAAVGFAVIIFLEKLAVAKQD